MCSLVVIRKQKHWSKWSVCAALQSSQRLFLWVDLTAGNYKKVLTWLGRLCRLVVSWLAGPYVLIWGTQEHMAGGYPGGISTGLM